MSAARWSLADLPESVRAHVSDCRPIHLPGNVPPWTESGLVLAVGDEVTWFAAGRLDLFPELGLWGGPCFHLWARLGGQIFKGTRDTFSFRADRGGPLELATYQGEWATRDGTLATPVEAYQTVKGALDVTLIRWRGTAAEGLRALRAAVPDDALVEAEMRRQSSPAAKPPGWEYLWFLGDGEIFSARPSEKGAGIAIHTQEDVGILQKRTSVPLTPETSLSWRWNVARLPATEAENTIPTHDYMSIAVEFENGLDLTYYWSAALPVGTVFTCPLPTWAPRETHVVARSGAQGLGTWQSESRNLYADYRQALGEPPARIVGVWLIAVSLFRHGEGAAEFADIEIAHGAERTRIL